MDAYVDWRNQCSAVRVAYSCWESARASDAVLWHSAYTAALDREELAAKFYGRLLRRAGKFAPPELGLGAGLVVQGVDH